MTYNRDEVIKFWQSTGLDDKAKRKQIERLAQLTGSDVDHIKPLRAGGPDLWFNLQVLTAGRNRSKGADFDEVDQREYQRRWEALDADYKVAVQAALDGNPIPKVRFVGIAVPRRSAAKSLLNGQPIESDAAYVARKIAEYKGKNEKVREDIKNRHIRGLKFNNFVFKWAGRTFLGSLAGTILLSLGGAPESLTRKLAVTAMVSFPVTMMAGTGAGNKERELKEIGIVVPTN